LRLTRKKKGRANQSYSKPKKSKDAKKVRKDRKVGWDVGGGGEGGRGMSSRLKGSTWVSIQMTQNKTKAVLSRGRLTGWIPRSTSS